MTAILLFHGSGESVIRGPSHALAEKLRTLLSDNDLNDYEVIELSLTTDSKQDFQWASRKPMDFQLKMLSQYITDNVLQRLERDFTRIHLIGCSQGALLLRALLRGNCLDSVVHKLDTFITVGAPNNGIYGLAASWKIDNMVVKWCYGWLVNRIEKWPWSMDWYFYSSFYTNRLAFCSYWNSPDSPYRNKTFLALINNENDSQPIKYLSDKLRKLVLISFEVETVVLPAITSSFGYWDRTISKLIPYNETDFYVNDWFGLRTLDERKALIFTTVPNAKHLCLPLEFVNNTILPYLK